MSTVKQIMEFIFELDLADFEDDETTHKSRVGILIGVDYYFNFFGSKILKHLEGLVDACTHAVIRFSKAKYKILQLYPNEHSFFSTQTAIHFFTEKCKILKTAPKRSFVFHSKIKKVVGVVR